MAKARLRVIRQSRAFLYGETTTKVPVPFVVVLAG